MQNIISGINNEFSHVDAALQQVREEMDEDMEERRKDVSDIKTRLITVEVSQGILFMLKKLIDMGSAFCNVMVHCYPPLAAQCINQAIANLAKMIFLLYQLPGG